MSDLGSKIDHLLAERRPDRYEVDGGDEWLDVIAEELAADIELAEARRLAARAQVRRREGDKLKAGNRLLREVQQSGQLPLDWMDALSLPLAVGKERVALRAMSPEDFEVFAREERRRAASDFATRNQSCEAAEWLAGRMRASGCGVFEALCDTWEQAS